MSERGPVGGAGELTATQAEWVTHAARALETQYYLYGTDWTLLAQKLWKSWIERRLAAKAPQGVAARTCFYGNNEKCPYAREAAAPKPAPPANSFERAMGLHAGPAPGAERLREALDQLIIDMRFIGKLEKLKGDANFSKTCEWYAERAREALAAAPPAKPTHAVGVSVLVTNGDSVLLGERTNNTAAGLLSTPGGRIEPNETIFDCAVRETLEETGLSLTRDLLEVVAWREHFRFGGHYFMFYVHAPQSFGTLVNTEPDRCKGWNWHKVADVRGDSTTEPIDILESLLRDRHASAERVRQLRDGEVVRPNAVIEPLTERECEEIYYELSRYLGEQNIKKLTALYLTQKVLRGRGEKGT